MQFRPFIPILIIVIISLAAGLGYYLSGDKPAGNVFTSDIQGLLWPNPKKINTFSILDDEGKFFNQDNIQGKWSLVFFGYTNCPDICPITLSTLNQAYSRLQENNHADNLQVLFVSVDAERDSPHQLKEYVNYFNPEFIGLGGDTTQIDSLARQIGIAYIIGEKDNAGKYDVDHSASVFLLDPKGRLVSVFSAPLDVENIASRFIQIKTFIKQQG